MYNIGTGRARTFGEFVDAVQDAVPTAAIDVGPGGNYLGLDDVYSVMDITRADAELGYEPEFDFDSAVADYLAVLADDVSDRPVQA